MHVYGRKWSRVGARGGGGGHGAYLDRQGVCVCVCVCVGVVDTALTLINFSRAPYDMGLTQSL